MNPKRPLLCGGLGVGLLSLGMLLPGLAAGMILLRITVLLEGLFLIGLAFPGWFPGRLAEGERALAGRPDSGAATAPSRYWMLGAITLLGLILRFHHLHADLWIDEITTVVEHCSRTVLQLLTSYPDSNNHLLNTLLVKAAMSGFGDSEQVIRLPAVMFGTAAIPAGFWLARMALPLRSSLAAALLLAVSYHHIFYSQNARGYSAYLLFSLVSTGLLIRGLQEDRARTWTLYVISMVLNFASLLISGYVFAAHLLIGAGALRLMKKRGRPVRPLMIRLAGIWGLAALLGLQLYALILPQAFRVMKASWTQESSGFALFSGEFFRELMRGLSAGWGPGFIAAAAPLAVIFLVGLAFLVRSNWILASALVLPGALHALFLIANGLRFAPRLFILGLPLAFFAVLSALETVCAWAARRSGRPESGFASGSFNLAVALMAAGLLWSLGPYYSAPKQDFRGAIRYLQAVAGPGDVVVAVDLAARGFRYYGKRGGLIEGKDYYAAESGAALEEILSAHPGSRVFLATTLFYVLEIEHPEIAARIRTEWQPVRDFRGTLGGGSIRIWVNRAGFARDRAGTAGPGRSPATHGDVESGDSSCTLHAFPRQTQAPENSRRGSAKFPSGQDPNCVDTGIERRRRGPIPAWGNTHIVIHISGQSRIRPGVPGTERRRRAPYQPGATPQEIGRSEMIEGCRPDP